MTTVYADMVADLFHAGHVAFLRQARALGDELVVGLHTDDDCAWFKRRPVMTLDERVAVVEACRYVDRVIPGAPVFTTEAWLRAEGIDLVVHGDEKSEAELRFWYGVPMELGMFRTVPYTSGIATSDVLRRVATRTGVRPPPPAPRRRGRDTLERVLARSPGLDRRVQRRLTVRALRRLHRALRGTPIDGRYWVWGGALIGWAREGRLLESDLHDVDFAYLDEDHDRFLDSLPALVRAGFHPARRFVDQQGRFVEHVLVRRRARFEFFRLDPVGDRWRYLLTLPGGETAATAEIPAQERVPFRLVGRTWSKVADHDAELSAIYGDWRTPRPDWFYGDDHAIVAWHGTPDHLIAWSSLDERRYGPGEADPGRRAAGDRTVGPSTAGQAPA